MKKIFITILLSLPLYSFAADGPCKADVEKFCAGVKMGNGGIMKCLKEHEAELSSECKTKQAERMEKFKEKRTEKKEARHEKRKEMMDACKADKEKFCGEVKMGGGAVMKCMKEHNSELSAMCKEKLSRKK